MPENKGKYIIQALQKKWQLQWLLSYALVCLSILVLAAIIIHKFLPESLLGIFIFTAIINILIFVIILPNKYYKLKTATVTNYLNQTFQVLEESTDLLLQPSSELNLLQQLQVEKIEKELSKLKLHSPFIKKIGVSFSILIASLLLGLGIYNFHVNSSIKITENEKNASKKQEIILPQINNISIKIIPPSYTNKPAKEQAFFNLKVEENAEVDWHISTTIPVTKIDFIFNDSATIPLQPSNKLSTEWHLKKTIKLTGFYQVKINDKLSELYQIEVVKDVPPIITIQSPKPNTVIDFGQPIKVMLNLNISDDYAIQEASIHATISSGNGEAVKFKEQQISFNISFNQHLKSYAIQQVIDLAKLKMQPGDELYFYVKAIDNFKQESRSDIYIINLPDTTQLMDFEGLVNNINFKPEIFRSERQIIIDAEQLIKDKDTISIENFNTRSNNLGIDQKLLRLRYGKFLGEEDESNKGVEDAASLDATEFGDGTKMIDAFTDKHDNAEDASFLDADTKKRLKAVLNEMWSTELRLRTFKTQEALPFAYKALRLLKDLQQQSRAYVAKTSLKTTPLKPEKRLSADLSKILPPTIQQQIAIKQSQDDILKNAISILEDSKNEALINSNNIGILSQAAQQLSNKASLQPSVYLQSFEALKR
ncbi:MAG: hypothetical protein H7068_00945, partial [Pedobacter sp.]|nr:hypothetical protein [Chitinophagaceae bacterium]